MLCTTSGAPAPNLAVLAAYAPFADPGMGWADALLPLISIRPKALDRWVRQVPLFCAVTPDAAGAGGADPPPLILTPATSQPHANSHDTTQMAAFHWCRLTAEHVTGLAGRGGSVRLVDRATAAALLATGNDDGRSAPGGDLACAGGARFPPPLPPPHPPPGQGRAGRAVSGYVLTEEGEAGAAAVAAAPTPPPPPPPPPPPQRAPPPSYETLAACVGPLYGDSAWGLLAWFEHHLDAGIGHFYMYVVAREWSPATNPVHAVLAHHAAAGRATLRDWAPLGGPASPWAAGSWYFNQAALHNDCLNRARGRHRHVFFMDTDEFLDAAGWISSGGGGPAAGGSSGALTRAVAAWAALPAYEATHSAGFPCRWQSMLGDAGTRAQLSARDGLGSDPADEPEVKARVGGGGGGGLSTQGGAGEAGDAAAGAAALPPPLPLQHPPLARSACAEPLLDRLPYRSADLEHPRSKFVARPDAILAVEAHYVLEGAGGDAAFAGDALHHNHYYIIRDGPAAHPTAPRPRPVPPPGGPGGGGGGGGAAGNASAAAPAGDLTVPVPGMMAVLDTTWPARFVESGLRARVEQVAAAACGGL